MSNPSVTVAAALLLRRLRGRPARAGARDGHRALRVHADAAAHDPRRQRRRGRRRLARRGQLRGLSAGRAHARRAFRSRRSASGCCRWSRSRCRPRRWAGPIRSRVWLRAALRGRRGERLGAGEHQRLVPGLARALRSARGRPASCTPASAPASRWPVSIAGARARPASRPMRCGCSSARWRCVGLLVVAALMPRGAIASAAPANAAARRRRPGGVSWGLVICYGVLGFGYILPATFLPVLARAVVDDPAVFGAAWPVFGAAAAVSTLLASVLLAPRRPAPRAGGQPCADGARLPAAGAAPVGRHRAAGRAAGGRHLHGRDHGRHAGGEGAHAGRPDTRARPHDRGLRHRPDGRARCCRPR